VKARRAAAAAARVGLVLVLAGVGALAWAGPQAVRGPDGTRWQLDDDDPPRLDRRAPGGALDYGFGRGGLWTRPGAERSRALSLAEGPDGSIALGLERLGGPGAPAREVVVVAAGAREPQPAPDEPVSAGPEDDEVYLLWGGQRWQWRPGEQTAGLSGLPVVALAPGLARCLPAAARPAISP
jgi:hypothetical protein